MKRTNIHLSEDELSKLEEISKKVGLPKSELVRRAVDDFIEYYKVFGLAIKGITGLDRTTHGE